jgi:hypothetical protein
MPEQSQISRRAGWWLLAVILALIALNLVTGSRYSVWHKPGAGQEVIEADD